MYLFFIYLFIFLVTYEEVMKKCIAEDNENKSHKTVTGKKKN